MFDCGIIIWHILLNSTSIIDSVEKIDNILVFFFIFYPPQAVGYNSIEAEDWEVATDAEEMSKMESLLLDKNRKMEHELTQMKVRCFE